MRRIAVLFKAHRAMFIALIIAAVTLCISFVTIFLPKDEEEPVPVAQTPRVNPTPRVMRTPPPATQTPELPPEPEETPEPEDDGVRPPDRDIDFDELYSINPDVIAWIYIPGTNIDYPVVRSEDNEDYLKKNFEGERDRRGAIFRDMGNREDFVDRLTLLYGHNMLDGTMFTELHKFRDERFFENNREIKLYTPEGMRTYEVIAAYVTNDENPLYGTDYSNNVVWRAYIYNLYQRRWANLYEWDIGLKDQILTLSTCLDEDNPDRLLVQGVLLKDHNS